MKLKELREYARYSTIEVQSSYNGKVLCRNYNPEKHAHLSDRKINHIWPDIRVHKGTLGNNFAKPILCVYVDGSEEYKKEHGT